MKEFDVVIVGGGPAGLSAAVWAADMGLSAALVEKANEYGGQLLQVHNPINNYLGIRAVNGRELTDHFLRTIQDLRFERMFGTEAASVDYSVQTLLLGNGDELVWKCLIAATGVRRRKLNIEGEDVFLNKGILTSGSLEREKVRGARVVIVGGGDAAFENALILSPFAERVTIVHRGPNFRARTEFQECVEATSDINIICNTHLTAIKGSDRVECVDLQSIDPNVSSRSLETDFVLIRAGVQPNSEWLGDQIQRDPNGYVVVGADARTSRANVYACGDVAHPVSPTVATAAGTAATAIKEISRMLTSS